MRKDSEASMSMMFAAATLIWALVACAPGTGAPATPPPSVAPTTTVESTTTTTIPTTSTTLPHPSTVDVAITEGSASAGSSSSNPRSYRLEPDITYRFVEYLPEVTFDPPNAHWEVARYSPNILALRWRGESGFRPGTLVVSVFDAAGVSERKAWERLEEEIDAELAAVDESLTWIATGEAVVGGATVEWRELRTTENKPLPFKSSPCVIDLTDSVCVWFESSARFLIVPVDDLTVTVLVTEQLCDCDLGSLPGRFDLDNELDEWTDLIEQTLAALEFTG